MTPELSKPTGAVQEPPNGASKRYAITVRVTDAELSRIDRERARVHLLRGPFVRLAAFKRLPSVIPSVNRDAWGELIAIAEEIANLNDWLDAHPGSRRGDIVALLSSIARDLSQVRRFLLGLPLVQEVEAE